MIQLKLEFQTEKPELPLDMDRLIVSFIKASLENYNVELFEELYDKGKSVIKPYSFAYYLPGARFEGEKILLNENRFTMFFSNADLGQTIHFINAFKLMISKKYPMNNNSMQLKNVRHQKRQEIVDSEIIVKMQSSLIVRQHNSLDNTDIYYTYDNPEFSEVLKKNVESFLQKSSIFISTEDFSIMPVKGKKIVANVFGRKVDANIGVYKLSGQPELLNLLYQAGMGARRSEGHGKFEIVW